MHRIFLDINKEILNKQNCTQFNKALAPFFLQPLWWIMSVSTICSGFAEVLSVAPTHAPFVLTRHQLTMELVWNASVNGAGDDEWPKYANGTTEGAAVTKPHWREDAAC